MLYYMCSHGSFRIHADHIELLWLSSVVRRPLLDSTTELAVIWSEEAGFAVATLLG